MKVVLVAPNARAHTITPPLGLGYLAACVRQGGHEAVILDLARERLDARAGAERLSALKPDLIGVGIMSTGYLPARELIAAARQRLADVPLVIGGPHVTALPEEALADLDVGLAIAGEAEASLPALVEALAASREPEGIPGLYRRSGGGVAGGGRAPVTEQLETLPFPAWDLIDPRTYPDLPHQLLRRRFPVAPVMTSRGCPFDCSFCSSTTLWGRKWRTRPAADVVDEIELLVRDYGVREIHFEDDNFTLKEEHTAGICEEILRRGLDITWSCPNGVRIDTLKDRLLGLMKRSGCYSLGFGIESGSQAVLDKNNKKLKLDRVESQVRLVKKHGIDAFGFFIIGLPGETAATLAETVRFACRVPFDRANFSLLSPLPGSRVFREHAAGAEGFDPGALDYFTPFPIDGLDASCLKRWQRRAVWRFYLRPRQLAKLAGYTKPGQVAHLLKALKDYSR